MKNRITFIPALLAGVLLAWSVTAQERTTQVMRVVSTNADSLGGILAEDWTLRTAATNISASEVEKVSGPWTWIAPDGTNDMTATIQTAINTYRLVRFNPDYYHTSGTITLTNDTILEGNWCNWIVASNLTGYALYWPTNVTNCKIQELAVDGGFSSRNFADCGTGVTNVFGGNFFPEMSGYSPMTNHSGFFISMAGSGVIKNLTASGFTGYGFFLNNTNGTASYAHSRVSIEGENMAVNNYIGVMPAAWQYHNGVGTLSPTRPQQTAEYCKLSSFRCIGNTIGMDASVGNHSIVGAQLTDNFVGAYLGTGDNATHGEVADCTFNHNHFGILGNSWNGGESIHGNLFLATGLGTGESIIYLGSVSEAEIFDNRFVTGTVTIVSNAGPGLNIFRDNSYQGTWGTDFKYVTDNTSSNQYWGNYSETVSGNTDGAVPPWARKANASTSIFVKQTANVSAVNAFVPILTTNVSAGTWKLEYRVFVMVDNVQWNALSWDFGGTVNAYGTEHYQTGVNGADSDGNSTPANMIQNPGWLTGSPPQYASTAKGNFTHFYGDFVVVATNTWTPTINLGVTNTTAGTLTGTNHLYGYGIGFSYMSLTKLSE